MHATVAKAVSPPVSQGQWSLCTAAPPAPLVLLLCSEAAPPAPLASCSCFAVRLCCQARACCGAGGWVGGWGVRSAVTPEPLNPTPLPQAGLCTLALTAVAPEPLNSTPLPQAGLCTLALTAVAPAIGVLTFREIGLGLSDSWRHRARWVHRRVGLGFKGVGRGFRGSRVRG